MNTAQRLLRLLPLAVVAAATVIALTWMLELLSMPPPFSGYLALAVVGFAVTEIVKRRPHQRALKMFHVYLRARARGAPEVAARDRLLAWRYRDVEARQQAAHAISVSWAGPSEKERVIAGVAALLGRQRPGADATQLMPLYDRVRDRFTIVGWESIPKAFVEALLGRLDERERQQLDGLVDKYRLFHQKFFRAPTALGVDPQASVLDFARLLHSLGNRMAKEEPGDAERAYRLSIRVRPDENLAHAGLALLMEQTGRTREATREAKVALGVLDGYAQRAADRPPPTEDVSPFRSPKSLREALERVGQSGDGRPG